MRSGLRIRQPLKESTRIKPQMKWVGMQQKRLQSTAIYPKLDRLFSALCRWLFKSIKVWIFGQFHAQCNQMQPLLRLTVCNICLNKNREKCI